MVSRAEEYSVVIFSILKSYQKYFQYLINVVRRILGFYSDL